MTDNSKAVSLRTGGHLAPIYPQSIEDVYRLATMALRSGMLKPIKTGYGDAAVVEDNDSTLARGTMIIMQGMEIGVPPMQSLQLLAMINGRIVAHSEAVPGILLAKGFKLKDSWSGAEMSDEWTCTVELTRPDGEKFTGSFSVKDAKQAKLWDQSPTKTSYGKTKPNDSAWFCYPQRMLKARALGFVGKDGGADALKGIGVREEIEDDIRHREPRDITPVHDKQSALDLPDIPDISPAHTDETEIPSEIDPDMVLDHLRLALQHCDDTEEWALICESNEDDIAMLPATYQIKARRMLAEAAP